MLRDAWTLAIETLSWIELQKLSEHMAFAKTVKQLCINDPDATRLGYGLVVETVRRKNLIDKFINSQLKDKTLDEFDMGIQAFLRLYVYQTRITRNWEGFDLKEAEHIAKLARSILGWQAMRQVEYALGFLLTQPVQPLIDAAKDHEKVALQTYHPAWFVKYCFDLLGKEEATAFLQANLQALPVYLRLNTLRGTSDELLQKLCADGITAEKTPQLQHTYRLIESKKPLTKTDSFRLGLFYIQDKASCFAAQAANPKPDMAVLDVCAAPGAKTTYLAQLMQNKGVICSVDYSRRRLAAWRQETARMWIENAHPLIADACFPLPLGVEADVVILDPPCTSTGVFAKLPAAKWRLTPKSLEKMTQIQWAMICNCANHVKSGGILTYSTCSITLEENEQIIQRFLNEHQNFHLTDIDPQIGVSGLQGLDKCQRLYPHLHQSNGFFIAKLQKQ
ncbi:MAG: hypothetical protein NWF04_10175 [Candidatus Bathyarchaeota archaeon]|nr:hypothetical protein [Candidatus Bathyarchaeota archaeon]